MNETQQKPNKETEEVENGRSPLTYHGFASLP